MVESSNGLNAIHRQVQDDLLQLNAVATDGRNARFKLGTQGNLFRSASWCTREIVSSIAALTSTDAAMEVVFLNRARRRCTVSLACVAA